MATVPLPPSLGHLGVDNRARQDWSHGGSADEHHDGQQKYPRKCVSWDPSVSELTTSVLFSGVTITVGAGAFELVRAAAPRMAQALLGLDLKHLVMEELGLDHLQRRHVPGLRRGADGSRCA